MRLRKLIPGFAFAAFLLLGAGAANATSYDCDGGTNPVPANPPGDVDISETTACTISAGINASGHITISATKVTVGAAGLVATNAVSVTGTSGAFTNSGPTTGSTVTVNAVGTTAKAITATAGAVNVDTNNAGVLKITGTITAAGPVNIGGTTTTAAAITATGGDITANATSGALSFTGTLTTQTSGRITLMAPSITAKIVTATRGDITATATSGALSFTGTLTTTTSGGITLMAPSITTQAISSATGLNAQASSSSISAGNIVLNSAGGGSNTLIFAQTTLQAGTITEQGTASYLDIKVNRGGGNSLFTVGASGTNGVGNIKVHEGLFITNGTASSTGGVTFTGTTPVTFLTTTDFVPAYFLVQANLGKLTLPSSITGNGASGHGAGTIYLSAATIDASIGSTITANQNAGVAGGSNSHVIVLAASNVTVGGTGLNLQANGDGGGVYQAPTGSVTYTDSEDIHSLSWGHSFNASYAGSLVVTGSSSPLSETANGANGVVQLTGSSISLTNSSVLLQSNGSGGQQVSLYTGGALSFNVTGTTTLDTSGKGGAGGTINLYAQPMTVAGTSFTMNANADSAGSYNGGTITVYTASLNFDSTGLQTVGTVTANASGTGNAVYGDPTGNDPIAINFNPGTVTSNGQAFLFVGTGLADAFKFSANGGSSGGNAGAIKVNANAVAFPGPQASTSAISAAASTTAGNGNGGWVYIPNLTYVDPTTTVTITGFGTGQGGKFQSDSAKTFDVYKNIKVDGGAGLTNGNISGQIKLNNVTCGQILYQSAWPKTYWDCVSPSNPDAAPITIANGFSSTLKSIYSGSTTGTHVTQLFVFYDPAAMNSFFAKQGTAAAPATSTGLTFSFAETDPTFPIYVNVWQNAARGSNPNEIPITSTQQKETTAHEFGHAYDIEEGHPASQNTYLLYTAVDFLNLDFVNLGADRAHSTPRDPCVGAGAPFTNAVDFDGNPICTNGALTDPSFNGHENSYIAQQTDVNFKPSTPTNPPLPQGFYELFAQTFAFRAYSDTVPLSQLTETVADAVLYANQFACGQGYLNQIVNGSGASGPPAYCSTTTIPSWYQVGQ